MDSAPEMVRLEFINGRVKVKPVPDGNHREIVMWLLRQCMRQRPELSLYPEQGLKVAGCRKGRARPDAALAPYENFVGQGEWAEPGGVLMTVEGTSCDTDTNRRDRVGKPDGYAAAGIPRYFLVDRDPRSLTVRAEPENGEYRSRRTYDFGDVVELPDPVGITQRNEKLKDYED